MKTIARFGLTLFIICFIAAGSLAWINKITKPKILAQLKLEEETSLKEVLPFADDFQEVRKDEEILYYKGYKDKKLIGVAYKASGKGYSSIIETIVGMDLDGRIFGIKIISQNETPGLGSRIVEVTEEATLADILKGKRPKVEARKPWFGEQFKNRNVRNLDKEVQAITGATISSEAVIKSVKEKGIEILQELKDER